MASTTFRCAIALFVFLAPALLVASCGHGEDATPGCAAGNRSQCVSRVALGDHFGCARMHEGSVWCWGANDESQLGYATTDLCPIPLPGGDTRSIACHTFPFQVLGLDDATEVAAGQKFACALRGDKTVRCWGDNSTGQLGRGDTHSSMQPVVVAGLANVTALALGARHACALSDGNVFCWGADDTLQLGVAAASQSCGPASASVRCETQPKQVAGLGHMTAIAAGSGHTCAVADNGSVMCWGANDYGQLGVGSASDLPMAAPHPVRAGHLTQFASGIAAGDFHTCTVRDDGAVLCWGRNDHGELGSAPSLPPAEHCAGPCSPFPILVAALPDAPTNLDTTPVATPPDGGAPPDLAVLPDLAELADLSQPVDLGSAGDASRFPDMSARPVMSAPTPPKLIAAGGSHSCVLLGDGTIRCWGSDADGELGDGTASATQAPVAVIAQPGAAHDNALAGVTLIAAGAATSCARLADGSLRCWGSNLTGALGDGDLAAQSGPVPVSW